MHHQLHALALTERQLLLAHARWMGWNLALAFVPLLLALVLFRPGRKHHVIWWAGIVAFVGFLPNAPYVLTDVIHLGQDVRRVQHPSALLFGLLPVYAAFFAAGFACYVGSLVRLRRYLGAVGRASLIVPVEVCLHTLAAVGVFLGRFDRLNSWDILQRPVAVAESLRTLTDHRPLATIIATLLIIAGAASIAVAIIERAQAALDDVFMRYTGERPRAHARVEGAISSMFNAVRGKKEARR